ncbi:MAG TPA: DUF4398 domain-containing protein [Polyangiaceae bacterium]|nr:DUF4398 domain-containing protein [Polyangiaceae bacterium]
MLLHRSCAAAALALSACAASYVPASHVLGAQSAIAAADGAGAAQNPQADLHLRLAREQYSSAQRLIKQGATAQADAMLLRAQADAQLSLSLAREASAQTEARQMSERIRALSTTSMTRPQPPEEQP